MKICTTKSQVRKEVADLKSKGHSIGFVPTMGALHQGHLSLVEEARIECSKVVASIYVNPTQFNNQEDLRLYPRDVDGDAKKFESAGVAVLFVPNDKEIYPDGDASGQYDLGHLDQVMEGSFRPGHFQGVATVVEKLFRIVEPDAAFFGEKDYQQVAVIKRLVEIKDLPVKVISCTNIREQDGLAMSSRNMRLNAEERKEAATLFEAMTEVKRNMDEWTVQEAIAKVGDAVRKTKNLDLEYVQIADEGSLEPLNTWADSDQARIFLAVYAGNTRLIDNLALR